MVFNDLLMAVDHGQMSVLCLLDLSAAFDTVNHDLLLQGLERQFGVWQSVPAGPFIFVRQDIPRCVRRSDVVHCLCSVHGSLPQGSVLVPLFFILYTVRGGSCRPGCSVQRISSCSC